jgi:hypothetical protein
MLIDCIIFIGSGERQAISAGRIVNDIVSSEEGSLDLLVLHISIGII